MTLNLSSLEDLGTKVKQAKGKPEWRAPVLDDFKQGHVLAFDQSLSGCAAVALIRREDELLVYATEMFKTSHVQAGGHEENLQRAIELSDKIISWLYGMGIRPGEWIIAHEAPPIGGGRLIRPESSLLASLAVRVACKQFRLPVALMVSKQAHAHFICGKSKADKKEHHEVLMRLAAEEWMVNNLQAVSNGDKRDAFSIGLYWLAKGRR